MITGNVFTKLVIPFNTGLVQREEFLTFSVRHSRKLIQPKNVGFCVFEIHAFGRIMPLGDQSLYNNSAKDWWLPTDEGGMCFAHRAIFKKLLLIALWFCKS